MPLLELETDQRKPPPSQAVGFGRAGNSWSWDGLCFALPMLEAGNAAGWREVVSGARPSVISGTITGGRDSRGQVIMRSPGGAHYVDYADNPAHKKPTSAITVYARFRYNGTSDWPWAIFGKVHTDGGVQSSYVVYADNTSCNLNGLIYATSAQVALDDTATGVVPTGVYVNVFMRWRSGEIITLDVLSDGGAVAATQGRSATIPTGTIVYNSGASAPMRIYGSDLALGVGGDVSVFLVYARKLTDQECRALSCDPFLPFRRPIRTPAEMALGDAGMQGGGQGQRG
jgi:hypothetical protein